MIEVLNSYLVQHKSISIPGLGTLVIDRIPARSDFLNRKILPPAYQYRFDKYFDAPDKEFFNFLATRKQIADFEAIKLYNEWAYEFRNRIRSEKSVLWEGVGTLQQDDSGDILFEPIKSGSDFLGSVDAERVVRADARHAMIVGDRETTTAEMTEYLSEPGVLRKNRWWLIAAGIALLAITLMIIRFSNSGFNIESTSNKEQVLPNN